MRYPDRYTYDTDADFYDAMEDWREAQEHDTSDEYYEESKLEKI